MTIFYLARAGGGVLFALRYRILVRLEATNLSLFSAENYENAQTYSAVWASTSERREK